MTIGGAVMPRTLRIKSELVPGLVSWAKISPMQEFHCRRGDLSSAAKIFLSQRPFAF